MSLVLLLAAAGSLGHLYTLHNPTEPSFESKFIRFLLGLCLVGLLGLVLGRYSLAWTQVTLGLIAGAGILYTLRRPHVQGRPDSLVLRQFIGRDVVRMTVLGSLALLLLAGFSALLHALAPQITSEALGHTLPLAESYAREGRLHSVEGNEAAGASHLGYVLHTLAYYRGNEVFVGLLGWLFGLMACLALFFLGRRLQDTATGLISAAFAASAPVFIAQWSQAGVLLLGSAFLAMALRVLIQPDEAMYPVKLRVAYAGILLGGAMAVLPQGWIALVVAAPFALWHAPALRIPQVLIMSGLALCVALPFFAYAIGQPTWAGQLLPQGGQTPSPPGVPWPHNHESLLAWLWLPWDLVMRPGHLDGTALPHAVWGLLFLPVFLWLRGPARAILVFALVGAALTWRFTGDVAVLLPYLALLGPVCAALWTQPGLRGRRLLAPVVLLLLLFHALPLLQSARMPLAFLSGQITHSAYMHQQIDYYPVYDAIQQRLRPGDRLLLPLPHAHAVTGDVHADREWLEALAAQPFAEQYAALRKAGITCVVLPFQQTTVGPWLPEEAHKMLLRWWYRQHDFEHGAPMDIPKANAQATQRFLWLRLPEDPISPPSIADEIPMDAPEEESP